MDEGKKKMIMIGVIAACIIAAVIITVKNYSGTSGGIETIKPGSATVWLKCRDQKCGNTWQMDKRAYFDYVEKHGVAGANPPISCPKCGQETGYRAEKCEKCGFIFEKGGPASGDFPDRCPKCSYSATEEMAKKAAGK